MLERLHNDHKKTRGNQSSPRERLTPRSQVDTRGWRHAVAKQGGHGKDKAKEEEEEQEEGMGPRSSRPRKQLKPLPHRPAVLLAVHRGGASLAPRCQELRPAPLGTLAVAAAGEVAAVAAQVVGQLHHVPPHAAAAQQRPVHRPLHRGVERGLVGRLEHREGVGAPAVACAQHQVQPPVRPAGKRARWARGRVQAWPLLQVGVAARPRLEHGPREGEPGLRHVPPEDAVLYLDEGEGVPRDQVGATVEELDHPLHAPGPADN
mmetsp:Transcript_71326/g.198942  ORF Transcript_71326/g.198942 Transcript_71326/m.198942 type:complete len:262 (-) Transcript_71326:237-1022(-)